MSSTLLADDLSADLSIRVSVTASRVESLVIGEVHVRAFALVDSILEAVHRVCTLCTLKTKKLSLALRNSIRREKSNELARVRATFALLGTAGEASLEGAVSIAAAISIVALGL